MIQEICRYFLVFLLDTQQFSYSVNRVANSTDDFNIIELAIVGIRNKTKIQFDVCTLTDIYNIFNTIRHHLVRYYHYCCIITYYFNTDFAYSLYSAGLAKTMLELISLVATFQSGMSES